MLNTKQIKAISLLFQNMPKQDVAKTVNVTPRTISKWFKSDEFKDELKKWQDRYLEVEILK